MGQVGIASAKNRNQRYAESVHRRYYTTKK